MSMYIYVYLCISMHIYIYIHIYAYIYIYTDMFTYRSMIQSNRFFPAFLSPDPIVSTHRRPMPWMSWCQADAAEGRRCGSQVFGRVCKT